MIRLRYVAIISMLLSCAAAGSQVKEDDSPTPGENDQGVEESPPAEETVETATDESGQAPAWATIQFVTPRGEPMTLRFPVRSSSIGSPSSGSLVNGKDIGRSGPGFIQTGTAPFGTDETVMLVMFAAGELLRDYPNSVPALVGSLSDADGGPIPPHKSHQSGRDVDIAFFARENVPLRTFGDLDPAQIDFEKSLALLVNLVSTGRVSFIFINYALQKFFFQAARDMGYSDAQLDYLFQYPKGESAKSGIIRHAKGHFRHAHVRFACPKGSQDCRE
ncbi:MAG TPA: penicillin-insensitive murein endopeptidase [Myxococcota bacterium]|nr:penicillin-insensitive murein endopeptidase [Myxococcota bacterium]HOD00176.1 penicillin-insensitive murein endopeptidase [Myxococcota bacterium]HOH77635.1 penicillin-insensitive murein endopeptidase [Myxococcota bacterium]HPV03478.1 penicillin-insensitive murein endopeptidase [Myxococcota bacterium]